MFGSLHAVDAAMALQVARDVLITRRGRGALSIWVVPVRGDHRPPDPARTRRWLFEPTASKIYSLSHLLPRLPDDCPANM